MRLNRLFRRDDGAAMVEMAFVLPVFLLIVWGIIDFGRLLYVKNSMATAVREGARRAAVMDNPTSQGNAALVKGRVKSAFNPLGGPQITDGQISIDLGTVSGSVVVKVTGYSFPALTPLWALIGTDVPQPADSAIFRLERSTN